MAGILATMILIVGCDGCEDPPPPEGLQGAYELTELIPVGSTAVVFSANLETLLHRLESIGGPLPVTVGSVVIDDWQRAGAKMEAPGAAFWYDGQWVIVGWTDHRHDVELDRWSPTGERHDVAFDSRNLTGWREVVGEGVDRWVSSDGRRIAAGWMIDDDTEPANEMIWSLDDTHWRVSEDLKEVVDSFDPQPIGTDEEAVEPTDDIDVALHGAVDATSLLKHLGDQGRAGDVIDQLATQVGMVYWKLHQGDKPGWYLELYTPGREGEPAGLPDLGEAHETLPDLGGVLRPGTPGVMRLSADPDQFVALIRSTLEAAEQQQLDATLQMLREQLQVDLEEQLLDNLTGQLAAVVYGIEDAFFELDGIELLASLVRLDTARAAVVIPIEDSEEVRRVLDAFTQLSQGALHREAGEHTIQYARFDDGALRWAMLLSDEHLTVIDSMVAYSHVQSWERSPSPLEDIFVQRNVDTMLDSTRGLGMYMDVATVRTMLKEGGDGRRAAWLEPLEALRLQTDIDGRPDHAQLKLWLSDHLVESGGD